MPKFRYLVIPISFIVGMILLILPLPEWVRIYRPDWLALILIYWSMALPKRVGLWSAFIIGLLADSLLGTLLGHHALALMVITYLNLNFYLRIRVLSLPQQSLYVFGLLVISQLIISCMNGIMGLSVPFQAVFVAPLIGMLMWLLAFVILRDIRRKVMLS